MMNSEILCGISWKHGFIPSWPYWLKGVTHDNFEVPIFPGRWVCAYYTRISSTRKDSIKTRSFLNKSLNNSSRDFRTKCSPSRQLHLLYISALSFLAVFVIINLQEIIKMYDLLQIGFLHGQGYM